MNKGRADEPTCWTEIHAAAMGDEEERSAFADRYLPAVRTYFRCRWQGSPLSSFVEDAVQEVFVECFRDGGVLEKADPSRKGGFHAFLFGVLKNVALRVERRFARRHAKEATGSFVLEAIAGSEARLSEAFDRAFALSIVKQAGELLRRRAESKGDLAHQRVELLELRFIDGLPIREIAKRWQVDPDAVHESYRVARREYQHCLEAIVAYHNPQVEDGRSVKTRCRELLAMLH